VKAIQVKLESALALSIGRPKGGGLSDETGILCDVAAASFHPPRGGFISLIEERRKNGRETIRKRERNAESAGEIFARVYRKERRDDDAAREIKIRGARLFLLRCIRDI